MKRILHSQVFLGIFGGILGAIAMIAVFITISSVIAAPSAFPPDGNPTFPSAGPAGPQGPAGADGSAAVLGCIFETLILQPNQSLQYINCPAGYIATGGGVRSSSGADFGKFEWRPNSNTRWEFIHGGTTTTATGYLNCCRIAP